MAQPITSSENGGVVYYTTEHRGVGYTAYQDFTGGWQVISRRLSLRHSPGTCRRFPDVASVAANVKAFDGLDLMLGAESVA